MRLDPLVFACLLASACIDPDVGPEATPLSGDPIAACPIPSDPAAIPGHEADFYLCADAAADGGRGCGADGYLRGYGAVYAQRFYREARPRMTRAGQGRWRRSDLSGAGYGSARRAADPLIAAAASQIDGVHHQRRGRVQALRRAP